jgi:hypothetical protein
MEMTPATRAALEAAEALSDLHKAPLKKSATSGSDLRQQTMTEGQRMCQKQRKPNKIFKKADLENSETNKAYVCAYQKLTCYTPLKGSDLGKQTMTEGHRMVQKQRETNRINWMRHIAHHTMPTHPGDKSTKWIESVTVGTTTPLPTNRKVGGPWDLAYCLLVKEGVCIIAADMTPSAFCRMNKIACKQLKLQTIEEVNQEPAFDGFWKHSSEGNNAVPSYEDYPGKR